MSTEQRSNQRWSNYWLIICAHLRCRHHLGEVRRLWRRGVRQQRFLSRRSGAAAAAAQRALRPLQQLPAERITIFQDTNTCHLIENDIDSLFNKSSNITSFSLFSLEMPLTTNAATESSAFSHEFANREPSVSGSKAST